MTRILATVLAALALTAGLAGCKTQFHPTDGTEPVITVVSRKYVGGNRARGQYRLHLSNGSSVRVREYEHRRCQVGDRYPHCAYRR